MGYEGPTQLHQTVHERGDQVLRERGPRRVARTIRQKAARRSRGTTGRLAGRIRTGRTPDRSGPDKEEGNQVGARDPATSDSARIAADLRKEDPGCLLWAASGKKEDDGKSKSGLLRS